MFLATPNLRVIKSEIRVLGVDDAPHIPRLKSQVPVIGAIFRGGFWLDGVISNTITVDGFDATDAVVSMITESSHYKQLRVIMLNGVTFAGFNIMDITTLNKATGLPVIAVTQKKPDTEKIRQALSNLSEPERRFSAILNAGELIPVLTQNEANIYIQISGISISDAQKIIKLTSTRSNIPEPLRAAHLIASGISTCTKGFRKGLKGTMLRESPKRVE